MIIKKKKKRNPYGQSSGGGSMKYTWGLVDDSLVSVGFDEREQLEMS